MLLRWSDERVPGIGIIPAANSAGANYLKVKCQKFPLANRFDDCQILLVANQFGCVLQIFVHGVQQLTKE